MIRLWNWILGIKENKLLQNMESYEINNKIKTNEK